MTLRSKEQAERTSIANSLWKSPDCKVRVMPTNLTLPRYQELTKKRSQVHLLMAFKRARRLSGAPFPAELQSELDSLIKPSGEIILSA